LISISISQFTRFVLLKRLEFTSIISVINALHVLYRSQSFNLALSAILPPTFTFLQRLAKNKLLKNVATEIVNPGMLILNENIA
jgi:hypothetical protein